MNVVVLYYSATGNTRLGLRLIQAGIQSVPGDRCDLVEIDKDPVPALDGYDLIGFASPVFCFKPTLNLLALIDALPDGGTTRGKKPCFTFWTHGGGPENSDWIATKHLAAKGYRVIARADMVAPVSWTTGTVSDPDSGVPTQAARQATIEFGAGLASLVRRSKDSDFEAPAPVFRPSLMHLISKLYAPWMLRPYFKTDVDMDRCTRCGRCVRDCPTGRMRFEAFPKPRGDCLGCYRCINLCPEDAIEGWMTKGKRRYKGPAGQGGDGGLPSRGERKTL